MSKPNYAFWDGFTEFELLDAASLFCDLEPERWTNKNPVPPSVRSMRNRLLREVHYMDTTRTQWRTAEDFVGKLQSFEETIPGEVLFSRADRTTWARKKGIPAPFLFKKQREESAGGEWPFTHDTKLLRVVREVIRDYWEGQDPKSAPAKVGIVKELIEKGLTRNEAEAVDLVTRHDSIRNQRGGTQT